MKLTITHVDLSRKIKVTRPDLDADEGFPILFKADFLSGEAVLIAEANEVERMLPLPEGGLELDAWLYAPYAQIKHKSPSKAARSDRQAQAARPPFARRKTVTANRKQEQR